MYCRSAAQFSGVEQIARWLGLAAYGIQSNSFPPRKHYHDATQIAPAFSSSCSCSSYNNNNNGSSSRWLYGGQIQGDGRGPKCLQQKVFVPAPSTDAAHALRCSGRHRTYAHAGGNPLFLSTLPPSLPLPKPCLALPPHPIQALRFCTVPCGYNAGGPPAPMSPGERLARRHDTGGAREKGPKT